MSSPSLAATAKPRLFYLDWLRVLAMLAVFLYHNNRFFNAGDWHVKNAELSQVSTIFENALGLWLMPFLFVLSGAAVFYSLKSRSAGGFLKERSMRILLPLLVLGIFIFGPVQVYLERLTHGGFSGSFWQFIPRYFEGLHGFGGNLAWHGVHLWYLMLLFLFSLIFLLLFLPSGKSGASIILRLSSLFHKPWSLLLLFVPLALATHLTDALGMGITREMGGWDIFSYMLFFIYGYLLFANPRVGEVLRKYCFVSLIVAVALTVVWLVMRFIVMPSPDTGFPFSAELRPLAAWLWILTFLGIGGRYLNLKNRFLGYGNEAVLPFYIMHQPVILIIGYFVVQWTFPVPAKYLTIVIASFLGIMIAYELLVRRFNPLRFLFGMKLK